MIRLVFPSKAAFFFWPVNWLHPQPNQYRITLDQSVKPLALCCPLAEGTGATEAAGQLHLGGGGRKAASALGRHPGRGAAAGGADGATGAVEERQHPSGPEEEGAALAAEGNISTDQYLLKYV